MKYKLGAIKSKLYFMKYKLGDIVIINFLHLLFYVLPLFRYYHCALFITITTSSDNQPLSEDFNKKVGISVFGNTSPYYINKLYPNPLENMDWSFKRKKDTPYTVKLMQMLIPASFFTLAKIGQESDWFQNRNKEIRDELQEHVKDRFTIDDLTQYSPIVATCALNLCGISLWIGVAGYAVAAGTGFLGMYNNRHWLTDVVAGAGIGIMSVEASDWLYPIISKAFFRKRCL